MAFQNPKPHIGGKKFILRLVFDFDEWVDKADAADSILRWLKENPSAVKEHLADITPFEEYKK